MFTISRHLAKTRNALRRSATSGLLLLGFLALYLPGRAANVDGYSERDYLLANVRDVILLSSTRLARTAEFDALLSLYQETLSDEEGLSSRHVVVDSTDCQVAFGTRVRNLDDWRDVQRVIARIRERTAARYFVILGGHPVIPRPTIPLNLGPAYGGLVEEVESDGWYVDFNGDRILDEGVSVGRFADQGVAWGNPEMFPSIDSLLASLRTAIVLHARGGITKDNPIEFYPREYATPPFGVDPACTQQAWFMELLSTADMFSFWGHGEVHYFQSSDGMLQLDPAHLSPEILQRNHPLIFAWGPCNTGRLLDDRYGAHGVYSRYMGFPRDFQWAGAAAFIGRTTSYGYWGITPEIFFEELDAGARLGDALFRGMRAAAIENLPAYGEIGLVLAQHFCLYGDPTLRLTSQLPCNAHRPAFYALRPGTDAQPIRVNGTAPDKDRQYGPFGVKGGLTVEARPVQVGSARFIQKSTRGMTCELLISRKASLTGVTRISGVFVPGHYPAFDKYVFTLPPLTAGQYAFRVRASNTLGASQLPPIKTGLDDTYTLIVK